jgi:hypothetical protein
MNTSSVLFLASVAADGMSRPAASMHVFFKPVVINVFSFRDDEVKRIFILLKGIRN